VTGRHAVVATVPARKEGGSTTLSVDPLTPSIRQGPSGQWSDLFPLGDWLRHHSLRSWPVLLFLVLICVPSIALVLLGTSPTPGTFDVAAWIFAAYFAIAWLLLLGVIIRPDHVTRPMLISVAFVALVTEVPLALTLEEALHSSNASLGGSIFTIGLPEELAKALPVAVIALIYKRSHHLMPRDYLFLGAVSGLVFGASEVVRYFTVNAVQEFYLTVKAAIPPIEHLIKTGNSAPTSIFDVLIGPVLYFIIEFVWRFLTDPITHACWAGLTGYFIGLAVTSRHHWYTVGWVGLAMAAVLHGLNDWATVSSQAVWILVVLASGILFLGYARVGARNDLQFPEMLGRPANVQRTTAAPASAAVEQGPTAAVTAGGPSGSSGHSPRTVASKGANRRPWWEH
jgi:RsiW-degrading membrane proteinase PrsW (M82 family)